MHLKIISLILCVLVKYGVSYQGEFYVDSRCCAPGYFFCLQEPIQWQYIPYYPGVQMINLVPMMHWPYIRYPMHHYYFRPPLSYHYYNPCRMNLPHCYELSKIYKCCVDYCGRTKCEQIFNCEIEIIGSGSGPESDEEVTKCVEPETLIFLDSINDNNIDIIDENNYYSDFVFDN